MSVNVVKVKFNSNLREASLPKSSNPLADPEEIAISMLEKINPLVDRFLKDKELRELVSEPYFFELQNKSFDLYLNLKNTISSPQELGFSHPLVVLGFVALELANSISLVKDWLPKESKVVAFDNNSHPADEAIAKCTDLLSSFKEHPAVIAYSSET